MNLRIINKWVGKALKDLNFLDLLDHLKSSYPDKRRMFAVLRARAPLHNQDWE